MISPMVSAGSSRGVLEDEVHRLSAQSGTNVEAGLVRGFQLAAESLTPNAVNRVVLLSDGVGNIGETDQARILEKVAEFRAKGIYLNTIGVGLEDHNDHFLEQLADRGDGVYEYIDSEKSARRALVENFTGAFQPIARDVKIQVELSPEQVESYRQLGYENRALADADFRNDAIDAGEINAGHQVTCLYELQGLPAVPDAEAALVTVRVRYKEPFAVDRGEAPAPEDEEATELSFTLKRSEVASSFEQTSPGYRRDVLVAQFAEHLRRSIHAHYDSYEALIADAARLQGELADPDFDEMCELLVKAQPWLEQELEAQDGRLFDLTRQLCDLRYRQGRRELLREEVEEEVLEEERRQIAELETRIRALVRDLMGAPPLQEPELTSEEIEMLRALGYR